MATLVGVSRLKVLRGLFVWYLLVCYICAREGSGSAVDSNENELTISVAPGKEDCFYQQARPGQILDIEYQVLDASFDSIDAKRKMEISFSLYSPRGVNLISDIKRSNGLHRHEVKEGGDYKICFDNMFSHFSTKVVYFDIFVDSDDEDDRWDNPDVTFLPEMLYNDTMSQIKISVNKVRDNLNRIQHFQYQRRSIEARDRNIQEHNLSAVSNFSMLIIAAMLLVGGVQVLMVRSLFEEKSKLHKIFKVIS